MIRKVTTDEAAPQKFAPHGRFEYQPLDEEGNLLHIHCQGPFDEALILAIRNVQTDPVLLNPNRKEVFEFSISCLGIPQFVEQAAAYLEYLVTEGKAPKAVALVMPDDIEGANLMRNVYIDIYQANKITVAAFESSEDAFKWLQAK